MTRMWRKRSVCITMARGLVAVARQEQAWQIEVVQHLAPATRLLISSSSSSSNLWVLSESLGRLLLLPAVQRHVQTHVSIILRGILERVLEYKQCMLSVGRSSNLIRSALCQNWLRLAFAFPSTLLLSCHSPCAFTSVACHRDRFSNHLAEVFFSVFVGVHELVVHLFWDSEFLEPSWQYW